MKAKIVSLALLAMMTISAIAVISPAFSLPADSMWTSPLTIDGATVGYHGFFNVTVYLNVTTLTNSWQFYMVYPKDLLNATACVYSGPGYAKSQWSAALPVDTVTPGFGAHDATHNYVVFGEVLKSSAQKTGLGSLAIVTFQVMKAPGKHETLSGNIVLDTPGVFKSYAQDALFQDIPLTFGHSTYTWVWVTPPNAQLAIAPTSVTRGGSPPGVIGTTFTETVTFTVDAGWSCHNVSFTVHNDNATLLTVSAYTVNPLWTSYVVTNATAAAINVFVNTPSSTPSGAVNVITIKYKILDQGFDVRTYIAHLTFSNQTAFDTTSTIPIDPPNSCLVTINGLATRIPAYLKVSSITLGPNPALGQLFNVTVKVFNLDRSWYFIGLDFRLARDDALTTFAPYFTVMSVTEGSFLPYSSTQQPGSLGTWFTGSFWPTDGVYPDNVLVGNLIFPNASGLWPIHTSQYPSSNSTVPPPAQCGNTVATITFRLDYQSFGEPNLTIPLNIIEQDWIGIDPGTVNDTQDITYLHMADPKNGAVTITTHWPGKMLDAYTQYPAPYGGQGLNMPSDMFWPQKQVELYANVTYNYWPVQQKDVAFEVRDPSGNLWTQQVARSDVNGVAHTSFRIPWPCDHPETLFGVWTVTATVDLYCTVVTDTLRFHFDYQVEIFSVTTDKFQYNHCDNVKVTVKFGTHAQQKYPLLLYVVIYDNVNVPVGIAMVNMTIGGTVFCQYKNYTATVSIHIPKFAAAGIATVIVNAFNILPSKGGSAYCPTYGEGWPIGSSVPTIAIQPY